MSYKITTTQLGKLIKQVIKEAMEEQSWVPGQPPPAGFDLKDETMKIPSGLGITSDGKVVELKVGMPIPQNFDGLPAHLGQRAGMLIKNQDIVMSHDHNH